MRDFEDQTIENLSALARVIGAENVADVQKRIGDLIVAQVASDIKHYDCYLFYPPDYKGVISNAFEDVQKRMTKMYKDAMLDVAEKAVEKFKEVALASVDKMGE